MHQCIVINQHFILFKSSECSVPTVKFSYVCFDMISQEKERRYKELGIRDKITLTSGRFLLGNKWWVWPLLCSLQMLDLSSFELVCGSSALLGVKDWWNCGLLYRYARTFIFFYSIGLHMLVFASMYRFSSLSHRYYWVLLFFFAFTLTRVWWPPQVLQDHVFTSELHTWVLRTWELHTWIAYNREWILNGLLCWVHSAIKDREMEYKMAAAENIREYLQANLTSSTL